METVEAQIAALKTQLQAHASQISQLHYTVDKLRGRLQLMPLERFELFPKLAPELRNLIWEYSLPAPRLITVGLEDINGLPNLVYVKREKGFKSSAYWFCSGNTSFQQAA